MSTREKTRVERVLERLGIHYELRGDRAWARCPFHTDHNPSWMIRTRGRREGQHHCFACKAGGKLVSVVMKVRHIEDEDDAFEWLRSFKKNEPVNIRVRVREQPPQLGRQRFQIPSEVIFDPLSKWVSLAQRYARKRGITDEQVQRFGIGYAVNARLAGRIVIPYRGFGGHPAGYSARTFVDDDVRYLTPHESEGADLGVPFGEHLWPIPMRRHVVVVTEGAIDALAVDRVSDPFISVAALNGSEVNPMQITKLATFTKVVILTDNDPAGHKAATQLTSSLSRHVQLERVLLPSGMDAAKMKPDVLAETLRTALERDDTRGSRGNAEADPDVSV
jgi:DNA primase